MNRLLAVLVAVHGVRGFAGRLAGGRGAGVRRSARMPMRVALSAADGFDLSLAERIASGEASDDDFDDDNFGEYVIEPLLLEGEELEAGAGAGAEDFEASKRGANRHEEWDTSRLPLVAVVGRPNVGKSMIVNRLSRQFQGGSITYDMPGITRDRTYRPAYWNNQEFRVRASSHTRLCRPRERARAAGR
jgi:hypothetical protein